MDSPGDTATARADEALPAQLPDDDERVTAGLADLGGEPAQVVVEVGAGQRGPGDPVQEREVAAVALLGRRACGGAGCGHRRSSTTNVTAERGGDHRGIERPPPAPTGRGVRFVQGQVFGGRQEPLQVTQSIAPVAARIDPVVAQPAGIAPGADRVRVDAQEPGSLGHGQGGVRRPWRQAGIHRTGARTVKSTPRRLPISQFLPIGRRSRCPAPGADQVRRPPVMRT